MNIPREHVLVELNLRFEDLSLRPLARKFIVDGEAIVLVLTPTFLNPCGGVDARRGAEDRAGIAVLVLDVFLKVRQLLGLADQEWILARLGIARPAFIQHAEGVSAGDLDRTEPHRKLPILWRARIALRRRFAGRRPRT